MHDVEFNSIHLLYMVSRSRISHQIWLFLLFNIFGVPDATLCYPKFWRQDEKAEFEYSTISDYRIRFSNASHLNGHLIAKLALTTSVNCISCPAEKRDSLSMGARNYMWSDNLFSPDGFY